ncbi:DUF3800 domain-containing protein [Thalassospira marina]|uniref:DUF3800 domain-containing protein n=1 Tax=Thalassospira marina TaxID=2048283 RepID=UPI0012FF3A97|nr:DUF3800 domain-containing protein [Thalassospira marina]
MKYTVLIDESGNPGIKKIQTEKEAGASPYMTMGGVIIKDSSKEDLKEVIRSFTDEITNKGSLHCSSLSHEQKVRYSQVLATLDVVIVGVISKKSTLGGYRDQIAGDHKKYYNKCAQYLLERVGMYLGRNDISPNDVSIVFEDGGFNYSGLRGLVRSCQRNPIQENSKFLRNINVQKILATEKKNEPLLQLADLVAHALYRCVDGGRLGVLEGRYLEEIKPRFFACPEGKTVLSYGLYPVHTIDQLGLDVRIKRFLSAF